jgi:prophage DNA circulation protein
MSDTTTVGELVVVAAPVGPARAPGLQQASWRGVPFGVLTGDGAFGRRVELHEYPYRDRPYAEDLGRAARKINLLGFLVTDSRVYGGGDVVAQREQMIAACEQQGSGILIHPTLGALKASLLEPATIVERWDSGRYFELQFRFVEAGLATFPANPAQPKGQVAAAAAGADTAAAGDFAAAMAPLTPIGGLTVETAIASVAAWGDQLLGAGGDAGGLIGLASQIAGPFGRYANGANAGFIGGVLAQALPLGTTTLDLALGASAARATLAAAVAGVATLAGELGLPGALAPDLASAVQASVAALAATCADPADAVRLLASLAAFAEPSVTAVSGPIGDLHRRALATALARAGALYQPSSHDDAVAVRGLVAGALDTEIEVAGDSGEDATFDALRALRAAVVQDLASRGAALAPLATFTLGAALPSLALANRLYRDATRADELVAEADPVNPLFMPPSFRALAV